PAEGRERGTTTTPPRAKPPPSPARALSPGALRHAARERSCSSRTVPPRPALADLRLSFVLRSVPEREREPLPSPPLDEQRAADFLGLSVHTLRKWRRLQRGPRFVKYPGKL